MVLMYVSFRTALLVLAALAPASVAPAQVLPASLIKPASAPAVAMNDVLPVSPPSLIEPAPDVAPVAETSEIKPVRGESLTAMVARVRGASMASRERECLATAIYFESKSEPLSGQLAVGEVLANRVKSGRFASSYCGVVLQRGQFSFVRGGALPNVPRAGLQWKNAVAIATIVDERMMHSEAPRALFFHAKRVSPAWHATRVATIGNHIFYR